MAVPWWPNSGPIALSMLAVADGAEVEVPAVYTGVLTTQSEKVTPRAART